ncbi:hypothetical protein NPIL_292311 [Nephila pilipes]|uniref:Uncharacterized protein n=1 Tax=Nephila pilipes TaxID=299642 RepID=A0A8X6MTA7_NEPPI|nr:hypothetical protein NPIL_292311 [Nephila pilipes]
MKNIGSAKQPIRKQPTPSPPRHLWVSEGRTDPAVLSGTAGRNHGASTRHPPPPPKATGDANFNADVENPEFSAQVKQAVHSFLSEPAAARPVTPPQDESAARCAADTDREGDRLTVPTPSPHRTH